jgi:hypothetical protein
VHCEVGVFLFCGEVICWFERPLEVIEAMVPLPPNQESVGA